MFSCNSEHQWLRRILSTLLWGLVGTAIANDPPHEAKPLSPVSVVNYDNKPDVFFFWKNGLFAETRDQAYRFHLGGRMDFDNGWYQVPANIQDSLNTPMLDGTAVRRFRLGFDGFIQRQLEFKLEADFTRAQEYKEDNNDPQSNVFITDAWIALHDLPMVGTIKMGHQKEFLSFNNATSSRFYPFMERPYIFDGYESDFGFGSGISFHRTYFDDQMTSWAGLFWNGTRNQSFSVGSGYTASGRLTWMPIYDEQQNQWLNLGAAGSFSAIQMSGARITVRPLVRTGQSSQVPNLIDSGELNGENGQSVGTLGIHGAWGPITIGGEYQFRSIPEGTILVRDPNDPLSMTQQSVGNLFFPGFYVEALCFLTPGDHRGIDRKNPGYGRITPVHSFLGSSADGLSLERGYGAWELGIRFDHIDVNSGSIQAGSLNSMTLGLNWYLNPNAAVLINYVYTNRNSNDPATSGSINALGLRFHVDF